MPRILSFKIINCCSAVVDSSYSSFKFPVYSLVLWNAHQSLSRTLLCTNTWILHYSQWSKLFHSHSRLSINQFKIFCVVNYRTLNLPVGFDAPQPILMLPSKPERFNWWLGFDIKRIYGEFESLQFAICLTSHFHNYLLQ